MIYFKHLVFHTGKALSCNDRLQQTFGFPYSKQFVSRICGYAFPSPPPPPPPPIPPFQVFLGLCATSNHMVLIFRETVQTEIPKVETITYQSVLQNELLGKEITEVPVSFL